MVTENNNLQTAIKLEALDEKLGAAIARVRNHNRVVLALAIISVALIGGWLYYAHARFSNEVNPDLAAHLAQAYLESSLPQAGEQLEQSLKENAPSLIAAGERQLRGLPAQFTAQFRSSVNRAMDAEMPKVQEALYQNLKAALEKARQTADAAPGQTDEQRFHAMADALTAVYKTETLKLVDDQYAQYLRSSGDIMTNLEVLAENRGLTPVQQSHRDLLCNFLALAAEYNANSAGQPASAGGAR